MFPPASHLWYNNQSRGEQPWYNRVYVKEKGGDKPVNSAILLIGSVILICILMSRFLEKLAVPSLLIFLALGMCFGENGIFRIPFDDYAGVNLICSVCLIFIMFYGGFGTNLQTARPVVAQAAVLSTLGVAGTALAVGLFAWLVLKLPWLESLLIGSVISSTDAASVFSILRSKKLALKHHTDSLLEMESGSNDPISYMLTTACLSLMAGEEVSLPLLLAGQMVLGIGFGLLTGAASAWLLRQDLLRSQESRTVFLFAVMLLSYALPAACGGNGYLSAYLCGIWLGNSKLTQKRYLVHFFDVVTHVAQVLIFFLLGLLVTPVRLPAVLLPALAVMAFLTFAARPLVCTALLLPFRAPWGQIGITAWAGLRGAASIVFAISAVLSGIEMRYDLFNLVFCIVLLSMAVQGTLLPRVAGKLSMTDRGADVGKTFTDYQEESDIGFVEIRLGPGHLWCGMSVSQLSLPAELLVAMVDRGGTAIVPRGDTELQEGDRLVLAARSFEDQEHLNIREVPVERGSKWAGQPISRLSNTKPRLIILIKRGLETVIPTGSTVICPGDVLVVAEPEENA